MGLDSVEIVMAWEETFGITLTGAEVTELLTPRQAIDLICAKLHAADTPAAPCPAQRAYHTLRRGLRSVTGQPHRVIRLSDRLRDFRPQHRNKDFWAAFGTATSVTGFREPGFLFQSATVREAVEELIRRHLRQLLKPGEPWTRGLVRHGVRQAVIDVTGTGTFSDDARFIQDIGID